MRYTRSDDANGIGNCLIEELLKRVFQISWLTFDLGRKPGNLVEVLSERRACAVDTEQCDVMLDLEYESKVKTV